jgi:hypothetical protein
MTQTAESVMAEAKKMEAVLERYAPAGYDPAADDMTIPFAIKLVEKDNEIAKLRAGLERAKGAIQTLSKRITVGDFAAQRIVDEELRLCVEALRPLTAA